MDNSRAEAMEAQYPKLHVLRATKQTRMIMTVIRNRETPRNEFVFYADRITRLLVEEALCYLPTVDKEVITPTGSSYKGVDHSHPVCGVSIIRAGESMEKALREVCLGIRIGKILIQRNEETAQPVLFYTMLPEDIAERKVILMDPMLATGGSAGRAIEILKERGVPEDNIIFVSLVSCPEGISYITKTFPGVLLITGEIDEKLNEKAYIIPGLGDFGDLYYGTVHP